MRIMRTARRQPYVVLFESAYHGFGVEIALAPETTFDEQHKYVIRVPWNDAGALLEVADRYGEQLAGVMLNPLDQNPAQPTRGVSPEIIDAIARFRERTGALVTVDDVRNGFRLHPRGSHVHMGIDPGLICLGKAQANGYSTSTVLGREALRAAAERINFTATYMFSAVAFRAGIATIDIYERDRVFDHIVAMGQRLKDGIVRAGRAAGHADTIMSGPAAMPTFLFAEDSRAKRARTFARHAAQRGAIFHPLLNWFVSFAHKEADIDEAIDIARQAFALTPTDVSLL